MDICRIVSYLKTHLWDDDEPTLARIAQEHGYSAFHLSREFKNQAGYSIRQCIEALRIQRGIEQIMDHGMSVTDSALAAGYSSLGTFSNTFKNHTGVTPRNYPKEASKAQAVLQKIANRDGLLVHRQSKVNTNNTLSVSTHYPEGYSSNVTCVGLFPTAIPKGMPVVGAALIGRTSCTFTNIPPGEYYLLACELRYSANPARALRDNLRQRVERKLAFPSDSGAEFALDMRPPAPQDPPITMNFPILTMRHLLKNRNS